MKVFCYSVVIALACLLVACSGEKKEQTIILKYAQFATAPHFVDVQMERWAKEVHTRSKGKMTVEVSPIPDLRGAAEVYDDVVVGKIDIGSFCTVEQPQRFPITNALSLPLGFQDAVTATKAMYDLYQNYAQGEYQGVQLLTMFTSPPANIISTTPVKNIRDLKDMTLYGRCAATGVVNAWGAHHVVMPVMGVADALTQGSITGLFTSLDMLEEVEIAQQCQFVTIINEVVSPYVMVMNKGKFDSLAPELQKILTDLSVEQARWAAEYVDDHAKKSLEWAVNEQGVDVMTLSRQNIIKLDRASERLIGEWAVRGVEQGIPTEEVLATLQSYSIGNIEQ